MTVACFPITGASKAVGRAVLTCILVVSAVPRGAWADDASTQDLQGILPDYIPDRLNESDFHQLKGHWTDWAAQTGRLVTDFYTSDNDEVRGRRATLEKIQIKLDTMQKALSDPQYLPIYGTLADLHARLARRMAVSAALLKTLEQQGAEAEGKQGKLRERSAQLLEAIEEYEMEPTTEHMQAVRDRYDDIRRLATDGGAALTEAMRQHYLNYNLRLLVDETLMQDLIRDTRMESGYIHDLIAGADVTGRQWTNTTVNLDVKPCDTGVRFDLILDGTVRSSAQGETHAATVFTTGRHAFTARKAVCFDGDRFQHWCAAVQVGGANCPYAAQTCLSWAPLLGGLSENLALKVANEKGPESNAYAVNKIRREVGGQFDRETGKMLREAELSLQEKVYGPLREEGYYPDVKEFRSTETDVQIRTRLMEQGELGGDELLPLPIYPTHGALVQVHESLLNQIGDRLDLAGKRFTPDELKDYLKAKLEKITGSSVDLDELFPDAAQQQATDGPNPTPADADRNDQAQSTPKVEQVIFNESDAIRVQIRGGEVVLLLSMGLKLEGRDEIPPQRLSIPLTPTIRGDKIHIEPGTIGVSPIGRVAPRERGQQIARAGIMRSKMEEAFEPQDVDGIFTFDVEKKQVTLKVTDLRARGGWLSVIAADGISKTDVPPGQPMQQAQGGETTETR